jgi:hypothetical protein
MKVLIVAVLLAVMQTSPPIPRKTADSPARAAAQINDKAKAQHSPPTQTPPIKDEHSAVESNKPGDEPTHENTQKAITVRELPPVSVTKDWADYTSLFFAGLLVGAGIVGIGFGYYTLKAIRRQTEHLVSSERAWIQVPEVMLGQKLSFVTPSQTPFFIWLHPYILNNGRTHARITRIIARAEILDKVENSDSPRPPQLPEHPQFRPMDTLIERNINLAPKEGINWINVFITREDLERIKAREAFLYIYGRIDYVDVSETERHTGFCKLYWIPYGNSDPVFQENFIDSAVIPRAYTECT